MTMQRSDRRYELVQLAMLAEETNQNGDLLKFMVELVKISDGALTFAERSLLSLAFKNAITPLREAWSRLNQIELNANSVNDLVPFVTHYRLSIGQKIFSLVSEFSSLIEEYLLDVEVQRQDAKSTESLCFYLKLKADYLMVLAQINGEDDADDNANKSLQTYLQTFRLAQLHLPPTHPLRLSIALNQATLYFDVLHKPESACRLAETTFDEANAELELDSTRGSADTASVMNLIQENLRSWIDKFNND